MPQKVKMRLAGRDGNAFSLLSAFATNARRQGWTQGEIEAVHERAMSGDYDHLLQVLMANTESPEVEDE